MRGRRPGYRRPTMKALIRRGIGGRCEVEIPLERLRTKEAQMIRLLLIPCAFLFLLAAFASPPAEDQAPRLQVAQGMVDKAEKESITLKPRGADGKFQKSIVLKLTGTSRITTLAPQMREGKQVLTQRDTELKDLQPNQAIAVIYADTEEPVLLSAVVEAASPQK